MNRSPLLPAAALLVWLAGGFAASAVYVSAYPSPAEMRSSPDGASWDMMSLALGARRLFADLWFVRLMQYYGTPEIPGEDGDRWWEPRGEEYYEHGLNGEGRYPRFLALSRHILEVDPGFTAAALYSAGSLAFNLNRPAEAEQVLRFALAYRHDDWKCLALLAAIGYSRASDPASVARTIEPLLKDPDCPVMLKQLTAFLDKKAGDYAAAAAIYADIAATSRDAAYVGNARRELQKLRLRGVPEGRP